MNGDRGTDCMSHHAIGVSTEGGAAPHSELRIRRIFVCFVVWTVVFFVR